MNTVVVSLIVKNCISIHGFVGRDFARTTTDIVFLIDRITDTRSQRCTNLQSLPNYMQIL